MKKVLSMLLVVVMLSSAFTMLASAETLTANPTTSKVLIDGVEKSFEAIGNGPIDAVQRGMQETLGVKIKVLDYASDALIMSPGEEKTLQVVFYPADADVDTNEIQWATTAFEYAVVAADPEDGAKAKVTALEPGSASIKAVYGKHTAIIHLIVRPN